MNLRILEYLLFSFFLIISAFIAADMVNTAGKGAMQTLPSFAVPKKVKKEFTPSVIPVVEEEAGIPADTGTLPSSKLIGTITGAYPYAVFLDMAVNKQNLYRLRDDIGNGWLVYEIGKNKTVLKKGDKKEVLEVKFIEAEPPKPDVADTVHPIGGIKLDQREVESALSDLNKVMTQARVVPNLVGGKTSGYRMFNIAPGSIYTKLGLQNNDVVERVNGVEIKSPDALYQLFQQVKNESRITLDFNRGGRKESVKIEIR